MLDDFIGLIDSIFEVRLPPLLLILGEYRHYGDFFEPVELKKTQVLDDEDDEDFLDDPPSP